MRNSWVVGVKSPHSGMNDGSFVNALFGTRDRFSVQVVNNGYQSWLEHRVGLSSPNAMFDSPVEVPEMSCLFGLRERTFEELERFGIVFSDGDLVGFVDEVEDPNGLEEGVEAEATGSKWMVFAGKLLSSSDSKANDFLYGLHIRVMQLSHDLMCPDGVDLLVELAGSSLFRNVPRWPARALETYSSKNTEYVLNRKDIPLPVYDFDPLRFKERVREFLCSMVAVVGFVCYAVPHTPYCQLEGEHHGQRFQQPGG